MRKASTKSVFGWFEVGAIASGLGVIWWYYKHHTSDGRDLWSALGYPYGATGDIPAMQSGFKTGLNALPVLMSPSHIVPNVLTDISGSQLTDLANNVLTDLAGASAPAQLFTSRNATGINLTLNFKGSKPS